MWWWDVKVFWVYTYHIMISYNDIYIYIEFGAVSKHSFCFSTNISYCRCASLTIAEAICSGAHQAIHKPSIPGLEDFKGEARSPPFWCRWCSGWRATPLISLRFWHFGWNFFCFKGGCWGFAWRRSFLFESVFRHRNPFAWQVIHSGLTAESRWRKSALRCTEAIHLFWFCHWEWWVYLMMYTAFECIKCILCRNFICMKNIYCICMIYMRCMIYECMFDTHVRYRCIYTHVWYIYIYMCMIQWFSYVYILYLWYMIQR